MYCYKVTPSVPAFLPSTSSASATLKTSWLSPPLPPPPPPPQPTQREDDEGEDFYDDPLPLNA